MAKVGSMSLWQDGTEETVKPRNWVVAAGISLLLATLTFGYGAWRMFVLDRGAGILHHGPPPAVRP
jgi:hypothetical protein